MKQMAIMILQSDRHIGIFIFWHWVKQSEAIWVLGTPSSLFQDKFPQIERNSSQQPLEESHLQKMTFAEFPVIENILVSFWRHPPLLWKFICQEFLNIVYHYFTRVKQSNVTTLMERWDKMLWRVYYLNVIEIPNTDKLFSRFVLKKIHL